MWGDADDTGRARTPRHRVARWATSLLTSLSDSDTETQHEHEYGTDHLRRRPHRPADRRPLQRFHERRRQALRGYQGDGGSGWHVRAPAHADTGDPHGADPGHHRAASPLASRWL